MTMHYFRYEQYVSTTSNNQIFGAPKSCTGVPLAELAYFIKQLEKEDAPPGTDVSLLQDNNPYGGALLQANWVKDVSDDTK